MQQLVLRLTADAVGSKGDLHILSALILADNTSVGWGAKGSVRVVAWGRFSVVQPCLGWVESIFIHV